MDELEQLQKALDLLKQQVETLQSDNAELRSLVIDGLIKPIEKDYNDSKYEEALNIWKENYGDKLNPYSDKIKALEGDDYDFMKSSYDAWNETDLEPDEYVEALVESLDEQLGAISKAFGVPQEDLNAEITIENGEITDVKADTEPEVEDQEEVETEEEIDTSDEEPEDEEELDEMEQFQKELDEAFAKQKGQSYY